MRLFLYIYILMGFLNNFIDRFNKAEFTIAPNKKLKTLSKEFAENFNLGLVFYKGNMIADGDLTLKKLNDKTSMDIQTSSSEELLLKANMTIGDVEKSFEQVYGVKVQIKDNTLSKLVPNKITLGQASREEY